MNIVIIHNLYHFDDSIYFHSCYNYGDNSDSTSSCVVGCGTTNCNVNDWDSIESQMCGIFGLPDLNTSNSDVVNMFRDWIV